MPRQTPMLAVPVFRSRVAPVLNWCSTIDIFPENAAETTASSQEIVLLDMSAFDRLRILQEQGVRTLICGALSPELLSYGESIGLRIIHGIAGDIGDVLNAYYANDLDHPRFRLPGCRMPRTEGEGKE